MLAQWHVNVIVPAHNEELLLTRCLTSIIKACDKLLSVTSNIILVVDSSSDNTHALGTYLLAGHGEVLIIDKKNVGHARRYGTDYALSQWLGPYNKCWLANTDADSFVPANWLTYQLDCAKNDIQGIAGIVDIDTFDEHEQIVQQRFSQTYLINKDGSHPHVHGANLGIRADAYLKAGGWPLLETGEDHTLWQRLKNLYIPLKSDAHLCVTTSGRRNGKAPKGFADALAAHNQGTHT